MSFFLTHAQASASASSTGSTVMLIAQFVLLGAVFWFFLIRPQQKRMKEHAAKLAATKKGDMVVTGGGIIGKVTKVDDSELEVEIANGVKVKVVKTTLSDVLSSTGKPAND
jgi:preprotein translocase subunit YajC